MSCDSCLQSALDFGWDEPARRRAAEVLDHLRACPACRALLEEFDRLTAVLAAPGAGDVEPPGGWDAFERRLMTAQPGSPRGRRFNWIPPVAAVAASILIATAAFTIGRSIAPRTAAAPLASNRAESTMATEQRGAFEPPQLSHEVNAFDQVSKVFDGRASWMLVSNGASDVGVAPHPVAAASRDVLLLRLTMTRGGQVASEADVLVVPGQTANLTVPLHADGGDAGGGAHSLHYRIGTSADEPTRLAVWLDINTPQGGQPLAALATNLQVEPGRKVTAGQLATSAGDYELTIGFARAQLPGATP